MIEFAKGSFSTICADPPWEFKNQGTRAATDNHYKPMSTPEICQLPVEEIAAEDAHLYLWVTDTHMPDGLAVMKAWGFKYKQILTWAKVDNGKLQMGIGNYWRHCTEHVLFGTRGRAPALVHDELALFWAPRGEHSAKPQVFYDKVARVSSGPYLEMFAREPRPGWTVWGDQVPIVFVGELTVQQVWELAKPELGT